MNSLRGFNTILGQPLEFGNKRQIKLLEKAREPHHVIDYGGLPPYGENAVWICLRCGQTNAARKVMPLPAGSGTHQVIRTPWVYFCRQCGLGCLFYREDDDGEIYDIDEGEDGYEWNSASNVRYRFLGINEEIDLKQYAHPDDPVKFYNWRK